MQTEPSKSEINLSLLAKAGLPPLIVAAILGGLWLLLGSGFSGLRDMIFWIIPALSGLWYVYWIGRSGLKLNLTQAAVHGAVLGIVIGVVYFVSSILAMKMRLQTASFWGDGMRLLVGMTVSYVVPSAIICAAVSAIVASTKKQ